MARVKTVQSIEAQIKKAEERVTRLKGAYKDAVSQLDELNEELKTLRMKSLVEAIEKSGKSYEEVMRLIKL